MSVVNIEAELAVIDEGRYGKDVRKAISDALSKLYSQNASEYIIQSANFTIPDGINRVTVNTNSFDNNYPFFCWLSASGTNNYSAPLGFYNPKNENTNVFDLNDGTSGNRDIIVYALCYKDKMIHSTTTESTTYNTATTTGTIVSNTKRWFLNGTASGLIDSVSIKCKTTSDTLVIEGWEVSNGTLTRVFQKTGVPTAANTFTTFSVGYQSSNPVMVSVKSTTGSDVYQITDTTKSFNAYMSSDLTSPTLSTSSLSTFAGLNVTGYITYTIPTYTKSPTYNCIFVSKDGFGNYTSINEAISHANDGDTIVVFPGTYIESVEAWEKELHIMGVDKNTCIITNSTGNYWTPAVEIDSGSLRNFTIISTGSAPTLPNTDSYYMKDYCVHVDHFHGTGRSLLIENCILRNNHRTAFGMGGYANNTVTIRNCDVWAGSPPNDIQNPESNKRGVLYFHNRANSDYFANVTGQKMRFINNTFYCEDVIALFILDTWDSSYDAKGYTNEMEVEFINNMFVAKKANGEYNTNSNGVNTPPNYSDETIICGTGFTDHIKLSPVSYGNNLSYLNYSNS